MQRKFRLPSLRTILTCQSLKRDCRSVRDSRFAANEGESGRKTRATRVLTRRCAITATSACSGFVLHQAIRPCAVKRVLKPLCCTPSSTPNTKRNPSVVRMSLNLAIFSLLLLENRRGNAHAEARDSYCMKKDVSGLGKS